MNEVPCLRSTVLASGYRKLPEVHCHSRQPGTWNKHTNDHLLMKSIKKKYSVSHKVEVIELFKKLVYRAKLKFNTGQKNG